MFKTPKEQIWFFDCAWVPDPKAGRLLYGLPGDAPDAEVLRELWRRNGATPANPQPPLKSLLCRVVSIAAVLRRQRAGEVKLDLLWLPRDTARPDNTAEASVIGTFLQAIGKSHPQLVGFGSRQTDLATLVQRAVVQGVSAPEFCHPPDKSGEAVDYFARDNAYHVDLAELLGVAGENCGLARDEIATLSGIPGRQQTGGQDVAQLWQEGKWKDIVQHNCYDALTTYLIWLRLAHLAGHLDDEQYGDEQQVLTDRLLELAEKPETEFLNRYLEAWERLQLATAQ